MGALPTVVDYSKHLTLIRTQDSWGGCGAMATLHCFDIQLERVAPYSPDASYAFNSYVYNASMGYGPADPRVTTPNLNQAQVLQVYGSCPETSFPTNFDATQTPIPSDANFAEALSYRILPFQDEALHPATIEELKNLLFTKGPLPMAELFDSHVVALVGYDDERQLITYVNSWPEWAGGGVQTKSYDDVMQRFAQHGAWVKFVEVPVPPAHEAYCARIRLSHRVGRRYLRITLGVEGQPFQTVWDHNCQVNMLDDRKDLAIDVPLPPNSPDYWPPRPERIWCLKVEDNSPTAETGAIGSVNELTLVKRISDGSGGSRLEEYGPYMPEKAFDIIPGAVTTLYIPNVRRAPMHRPVVEVNVECRTFPDCPFCPVFDTTPFEEFARRFRRPLLFEVCRGDRLVARVGRLNERLALEWNTNAPNALVDKHKLRLQVPRDEFTMLKRGRNEGFELRLVDPWDRTVLQRRSLVLIQK